MPRRTTEKDLDKMIDDINKNFGKQALVIRRDNALVRRSYNNGKSLGKMKNDDSYLTGVLAFNVGAFSGRKRKNLKRFFESQFGPEMMAKVDILVEQIDSLLDGNEPLMEMDEIDDHTMIGFEPIIIDTMSFVDGFDSPNSQKRLTIAQLNEELKSKIKGEKVAPTDNETTEDKQLNMFLRLYKKFKSKLAEFKIVEPNRIESFLLTMAAKIQNIQITSKKVDVVKPKFRKPSIVQKEHKSPVGMKLSELLAYEDG